MERPLVALLTIATGFNVFWERKGIAHVQFASIFRDIDSDGDVFRFQPGLLHTIFD